MSASAQIEIAATPEECRAIFLDFANWQKMGDARLRSLLPVSPSEPVAPGSKIVGDFGGIKTVVVDKENAPHRFEYRGDAYYVLSGNHSFEFRESQVTEGHTTFVNSEKFARLLWVLVRFGLLKEDGNFIKFCKRFKGRVESVLERKRSERVQ